MNAFHQGGNPPFGDGPNDHFDEMTGLLLLEGQLDDGRAREVSAHADSCSACRQLLQVLQNENIWLREALAAEEEPVPARLVFAPQRGQAHWSWIAALGLGFGGAYTFWTGFVEPWLDQAVFHREVF
jgi:anti-sigma factor RsiW